MNSSNRKKISSSRRTFLYQSSMASFGLLLTGKSVFAREGFGLFQSKPNSLINGVQIGAITYSFRSLPGSPDQVLQYCIDSNISAIELMGDSVEDYAGKPINPTIMPPAEPLPGTLDWDIWQGVTQPHGYNHDYVNGQWRCWYDYGMGALGDWGAHLIDTAHEFLDLGLPYEVKMLKAEGHNPFFYPMSSTILFRFPARGKMPACDITWYDGIDNLPPIPAGYGVMGLDPNIPAPSNGKLEPVKFNPGKIIYSKELTFKGGSHGSILSIIPEEKEIGRASCRERV